MRRLATPASDNTKLLGLFDESGICINSNNSNTETGSGSMQNIAKQCYQRGNGKAIDFTWGERSTLCFLACPDWTRNFSPFLRQAAGPIFPLKLCYTIRTNLSTFVHFFLIDSKKWWELLPKTNVNFFILFSAQSLSPYRAPPILDVKTSSGIAKAKLHIWTKK